MHNTTHRCMCVAEERGVRPFSSPPLSRDPRAMAVCRHNMCADEQSQSSGHPGDLTHSPPPTPSKDNTPHIKAHQTAHNTAIPQACVPRTLVGPGSCGSRSSWIQCGIGRQHVRHRRMQVVQYALQHARVAIHMEGSNAEAGAVDPGVCSEPAESGDAFCTSSVKRCHHLIAKQVVNPALLELALLTKGKRAVKRRDGP
eukprot:scaffold114249_cov18-Tisochrysis_lutea.AAC.1